jgi:ribosome-associated translation inhibitor RaiA
MRINIRGDGLDVTRQLQAVVESCLWTALGAFDAWIDLVVVQLRAGVGRNQPDSTRCEILVTLRPSGDVHASADDPQMRVSIARATDAIRAAVEREVARLSVLPGSPPAARETTAGGALDFVLDDNVISHQQREMLERPENYLRPIRMRESWRPPGAGDYAVPDQLVHAFVHGDWSDRRTGKARATLHRSTAPFNPTEVHP